MSFNKYLCACVYVCCVCVSAHKHDKLLGQIYLDRENVEDFSFAMLCLSTRLFLYFL